jgi:hypothetical protein
LWDDNGKRRIPDMDGPRKPAAASSLLITDHRSLIIE